MSRFINPFAQHFDMNGAPNAQYVVFFGEPNQDPKLFPKSPFSDESLLIPIPATQVLDNTGGYGIDIFLSGSYSIRIETPSGSLWRETPSFGGLTGLLLDSIDTDLRDLDVSLVPNGARADVAGYYEPLDGGGGEFYWDESSTATDDGGTVILPTGHVGAGRWLRVIVGDLYIEQFGCKVDGVTDDSVPFQSAVTVAQETLSSFGGVMNIGTATITFLQKGREFQNDGGSYRFIGNNLQILGQAIFVFDSCKDCEIISLTGLEVDIDLRGVWRSSFKTTKFRRLLFGTAAGTDFSEIFWNTFYNASFQTLVFPVDRGLVNANRFFGGIIRPRMSLSYLTNYDYAITIEDPVGPGSIQAFGFHGVDAESGSLGFFDIDPLFTRLEGYFLFDDCYFDMELPELQDNLLVDIRLSQAQRHFTGGAIGLSLSQWDTREFNKSASSLPTSPLNIITNGDLKFEYDDMFTASPGLTWNTSAAGLYGKTVTVDNNTGTFLDNTGAILDGHYCAFIVLRAGTIDKVKVTYDGISQDLDLTSEWTVYLKYTEIKKSTGDTLNLQLSPAGGETDFNCEVAYIKLAYGRTAQLGSTLSPLADPYTQSMVMGKINNDGIAADIPIGWTSALIATGIYEITHNMGFVIFPTVTALASAARTATIDQGFTDDTKFRVLIFDAAGVADDSPYSFVAKVSEFR